MGRQDLVRRRPRPRTNAVSGTLASPKSFLATARLRWLAGPVLPRDAAYETRDRWIVARLGDACWLVRVRPPDISRQSGWGEHPRSGERWADEVLLVHSGSVTFLSFSPQIAQRW